MRAKARSAAEPADDHCAKEVDFEFEADCPFRAPRRAEPDRETFCVQRRVAARRYENATLTINDAGVQAQSFSGAGLPRATPGRAMDVESGEHAGGARRIPRRIRASRAGSSIREPFRYAEGRVGRSPAAKR